MILKTWDYRTPQERADVKAFLLEILQKRPRNFQIFVLNKVIKVLTDVARQEWPRGFGELFEIIQQMTQNPELIQVGLMFLKTVCEEFVSLRDDIPTLRKKEITTVSLSLSLFLSLSDFHRREKKTGVVNAILSPLSAGLKWSGTWNTLACETYPGRPIRETPHTCILSFPPPLSCLLLTTPISN